jgi:hypothetical protein
MPKILALGLPYLPIFPLTPPHPQLFLKIVYAFFNVLLWGPIGVVILFLCYVPYSQLCFVCILGLVLFHSSTSLTCVAIDAKIIIFFFQEFTIEKGGFFNINFF